MLKSTLSSVYNVYISIIRKLLGKSVKCIQLFLEDAFPLPLPIFYYLIPFPFIILFNHPF